MKRTGILYRTNAQAEPVIEELISRGIEFRMEELTELFFEKWQVKEILSILELACSTDPVAKRNALIKLSNRYKIAVSVLLSVCSISPADTIRFIRSSVGFQEYLHDYAERLTVTVESLLEPILRLEAAAVQCNTLDQLFLYLKKLRQKIQRARKTSSRVHLSSFHSSKGLEFDTVFVIGCIDQLVPHPNALLSRKEQEAVEEERRLFYVALTRAKNRLYLTAPTLYQGKSAILTPFLKAISSELYSITRF